MAKKHGEDWDKTGKYKDIFEKTFKDTGDRTKAATAASEAFEKDEKWR